MAMRLRDIMEIEPDALWLSQKGEMQIDAISCDSREEQAGALFVAVSGSAFKGSDFISEVAAKGAAAVALAVEEASAISPEIKERVVLIGVKDPKNFLRAAALCFYGRPGDAVKVIGITGTNGKTTFTYLMESIISAAGKTCGVVGTVNYRVGDTVIPAKNTTPGFLDIQRLLAQMRLKNADYCVMEVSSHALHQGRVEGIEFASAVFSNLTQDHLDYHRSMEEYFQAKALLFKSLKPGTPAVVNIDDEYGVRLRGMAKGTVVTYAIDVPADVRAGNIVDGLGGSEFGIVFPNTAIAIKTRLIGRHNVYNILSAAACSMALGIDADRIRAGIESMQCVPGRMEAVANDRGIFVFIDYAHTPDGLINVLTTLRGVCKTKIITVFGCGGDRDKSKRPKMGAAVCALSDHAVVTCDNPRREDPQAIINDILPGFTKNNYEVCLDRKEAIGRALLMAAAGDVVLVAGKGHEDYQILKDRTVPFNERAIIEDILGVHR